MINTVIMPKQGLQMTEGVIIEWLIEEGQTVRAGEPLFRMETDKLEITIDSQFDGILLKIIAGEGETVAITAPIAYIGEEGDIIPDSPPAPTEAEAAAVVEAAAAKPVETAAVKPEIKLPEKSAPVKKRGRVFITPRAKLRAAERGIDFASIAGSGYNGIIVERDILAYTPPKMASAYSALSIDIDLTDAIAYAKKLAAVVDGCDAYSLILYAVYRAVGSVGLLRFDGGKPVLAAAVSKERLTLSAMLAALSNSSASEASAAFFRVEAADKAVIAPPDGIDMLFTAGGHSERAAVCNGALAVRDFVTVAVKFYGDPAEPASTLTKIKAALENPVLMLM